MNSILLFPTQLASKKIDSKRRAAPRTVSAAAASPTDVFVLDFDGVIVDSEAEVSMAGVRAAQALWPEHVAPDLDLTVLREQLRVTRPALIAGFETAVMSRLLATGTRPERILSEWPALLEQSLTAWGVDAGELERQFEDLRNRWMLEQEDEYLSMHSVYPGVEHALRTCEFPVYFASSKKGHRVSKVMSGLVGIPLPQDSPRLYAGLMPPNEAKAATLRAIAERPVCKATGVRHFVDDRLETLKALREQADLDAWQFYMPDWGYNTAEQRSEAARLPGVRLLSLKQFGELLKWGVLMGVDDGCEPEPDEVLAGVKK